MCALQPTGVGHVGYPVVKSVRENALDRCREKTVEQLRPRRKLLATKSRGSSSGPKSRRAGYSHVGTTFSCPRYRGCSASQTVQTFAGHASLQFTMDRYGHLFPSDDHTKT